MLSLLPIFLYLLIIKLLDNFSLVKWRMLTICGVTGAMVCVSLMLVSMVQSTLPNWSFPLLEEALKGAVILFLIARQKILFFAEALCYGAAVGAGFAFGENILYAAFNPDMAAILFAFRGFGTALLHMGCTAVLAVGAISVNRYLAIVPSVFIHYLYNMFLLPEFLQLVCTIVFFLVIFAAISYYDERRMNRWLDYSIYYDVELLVAIHEGRLADTPTGRYLLQIKQQFPPEMFFDMICYIQLYLELLIKGKSRMLLEQEGLATTVSQQEQDLLDSMKAELHTLRRNISPLGIQLLRPILRYNREDTKVLSLTK